MFTSARLTPFAAALGLAALIALGGCASTAGVSGTPANVVVAATQHTDLGTFNKLVAQAGLSAALEGPGPVTVFAPTDEAFKALPAATLDKLAKDPEALKYVLSYHVVPAKLMAADVTGPTSVATLAAAKVALSKAGDFVTIDDGLVIQADIATGNGVLHVIDRVLTPPKK
jgi:uncharacterized surface protein with fasciclin (FAS1) repeats